MVYVGKALQPQGSVAAADNTLMTIALVFLLLVAVFVLFLTEALPPDVIALSALVIVALVGWVSPREAFLSFANEAPITVAAMFILSAGLQRCGMIEDVGRWMRKSRKMSETRLLILLMVSVAVCSAFINNTPVVVAFLPLVLGLAQHHQIRASRLLIPLSYGAILGGTCTLIGTSTNLVVSTTAQADYGIDIGIFEISGLGLIVMVTGIAYMALVGRHLLPNRESLASIIEATPTREYVSELRVGPDSPLLGKRVGETDLKKISGLRVQGVLRHGDLLPAPFNNVVIQENDQLVVGAGPGAMIEAQSLKGLSVNHEQELGLERVSAGETTVVEAVITTNSRYAGRTLRESRFRENFNAFVLAIHRQGENITQNVGTVGLRFGDTLLLRISKEGIDRLRGSRDLLLLSETGIPTARRSKRPLVLAILAGVVILAAFNVYPISLLALSGVVLMVLTRCLRISEAYDAIDWRIVTLIVGMIALGKAMENTGAAAWLVQEALFFVHGAEPVIVLGCFYLVATLLTEMVSNNAVAILLTPIAYNTAVALGLNPTPFMIAIMFAASASFATPIGYQTNTFIYGAGGYKFTDFVRVGLPLNLIFLLEVTLLIPRIWPLK